MKYTYLYIRTMFSMKDNIICHKIHVFIIEFNHTYFFFFVAKKEKILFSTKKGNYNVV